MESIQVQQRLRPLRYAFLTKNDDLAAAARAASLCSALWGGRFNPIVPADSEPTDHLGMPLAPFERRNGLLKDFDPDVLVNLTGSALPEDLAQRYEDRIVSGDDVIRLVDDGYALRIGFSISPMLRHTYAKEVRFLTVPTPARLPMPDDAQGWAEFVAFVFGSFRFIPELAGSFERQFRDALRAQDLPLPNLTLPADHRGLLFPLDFTGQNLRRFSGGGSFSSHIIFVGDHRSPVDLMAFWNIRATGRRVGFVPAAAHGAFEPLVRAIAEAGRYPINRDVMNQADIQKGPSLDEGAFAAIVEWVRSLGYEVPARDWPPRYGMEMEGYVGDIHAAEVQALESDEISFLHGSELTPIRMIAPPFADGVHHGEQTWSVDVTMRSFRESDFTFTLPNTPAVEAVIRRHAHGSRGEARLSGGGTAIALRQHAAQSTLYLSPVRTKEVFTAMFDEVGLKIMPSPAGRYAEQVIRKMGSLQGDCRVFKLRGVREVLDKLGNGSQLTKGNIVDYVKKTAPDEFGQNWRPELYDDLILQRGQRRPLRPGAVMEVLLDKRIIRPGMVFKCRTCFKADWYHVSEFAEEYTCRYCFTAQRVNFARAREWQYRADGLFRPEVQGEGDPGESAEEPRESPWEYRSDGMFRIPDSAQGSVAVILSLWRFNEVRVFERGAYITSFIVQPRDAGWPGCEIDYAHLVPNRREDQLELVLGQAERFGEFKDDDMENMVKVADLFGRKPYLAFSTLRDSYSNGDKARLRALVLRGYRVIALTREELDPYDLFRRFEGAPHRYGVGLRELAENTMHMNVGQA